ncbi:MAG TPA: DEAD/DEAH box helicase family protein [Thermoanaerobaculia bacterium]|nr:DEAD/DEAH box helicase family protein [Thermoanaerobaculia bacterium]
MTKVHTEKAFEDAIEAHLLAHGYEPADLGDYDPQRALFPSLLVDFVRSTQPRTWEKLGAILKSDLQPLLIQEVCKVMEQRGSLEVLRHGFKFYGREVRLAHFEPGSRKSPELWTLYEQNRLTVARQLHHDPKRKEDSLDLVLCLNGVPVVTCELKNAMTSQKASRAKHQYRTDRDPKAPIFVFKQRVLVHFAVDADEVWMTTRLRGVKTHFLPFNRGHEHGAGNPPIAGKHRTAYLWEEVCERRSLLDLIGRFIHLERKSGVDPGTGKKWSSETMIFPRYHQLDCVRKLEAAARVNGAGTSYLVQHSAGSGKSNSIAWIAHRLASLHDEQDRKIYHSVVVLTDRQVLDRQLQDTIYQFDHKEGVVEKIDRHSQQLAEALVSGVPIIISTIHKFGFIRDKVAGLPDRRYAVIVDEAHSSQSGEMAVNVKELLADSQLEEKLNEQQLEEELSTPDQLALRAALLRGPQPNLSFFAFTATPKHKTLEMFGHKGPDGKPAPFHLYSMRQAIEEKFILDVLLGYVTFKRFFRLAKTIAEDPQLDKRKAASALTRFVNLHPTNIAQKTEIIVEHFRGSVAHQLGGRAKAMVVTGSRLMAVKYKLSFDGYLQKKGYHAIRCLVAFSGEVEDPDAPGVVYTEVQMNRGIKETELREKFASDTYQVLLVANKYQTGFDQPLLCSMYVDKRLAGIQAVQTLSRLNRTFPGKERTFVLDFVNDREEILAAFQDYYESTTTGDEVDPQRLYELHHELVEAGVFRPSEVDAFAAVFYQMPEDVEPSAHAQLNAWLDPAVDRFRELGGPDAGDDERYELQEAFRSRLVAYRNLYGFLAQVVPFQDPELEKLYAFGRMLLRKLPRSESGGALDLDDDVILASIKIKTDADGKLELKKDMPGTLPGPGETGTGQAESPKAKLSTIIDAINQRFGVDLPFHINDFLAGVSNALVADDDIRMSALANDKANFAHVFIKALEDTLAEHHEDNADFVTLVFKDDELRRFLTRRLLDEVYERIRSTQAGEESAPGPSTRGAATSPLRRVPAEDVRPFVNAVPVYDLKIAAGRFSQSQSVDEVPQADEIENPEEFDWVALDGKARPSPGLFVAQVFGESMNRRIPNGAWCLWRLHQGGTRNDQAVLAQHQDIHDPEYGQYTVKVYRSEKEETVGESWRHRRITLEPRSTDASFQPMVFDDVEEGEMRIVAELVDVLG